VSGARGVVLNPKGNQEITFEWGMGRVLNNQAEALALFQGPNLLSASYIISLIVIRDLTLVIKLMHKTSSLSNGKLTIIVRPIQKEVSMFEIIECYHILRELNKHAKNRPAWPLNWIVEPYELKEGYQLPLSLKF
jgi:hypothetical protein